MSDGRLASHRKVNLPGAILLSMPGSLRAAIPMTSRNGQGRWGVVRRAARRSCAENLALRGRGMGSYGPGGPSGGWGEGPGLGPRGASTTARRHLRSCGAETPGRSTDPVVTSVLTTLLELPLPRTALDPGRHPLLFLTLFLGHYITPSSWRT